MILTLLAEDDDDYGVDPTHRWVDPGNLVRCDKYLSLETDDFLVELAPMSASELQSLVGLPDWKNVATVELAEALPTRELIALLTHEACRDARAIGDLSAEVFVALCKLERELELVAVRPPAAPIELPVGRPVLRVKHLQIVDPVTTAAGQVFTDWARSHFEGVTMRSDDRPW